MEISQGIIKFLTYKIFQDRYSSDIEPKNILEFHSVFFFYIINFKP